MRPTLRSWPGEWAFVLGPAVVDALPVREERKKFIRSNRKRQTGGGNPLVEQAARLQREAEANPGTTVLYGESAIDGHVFDAKDEKKDDKEDDKDDDKEDDESSLSSDDDPDGVSSLDEDEEQDPNKPRVEDPDSKDRATISPSPTVPSQSIGPNGTIFPGGSGSFTATPFPEREALTAQRTSGMSPEVEHFVIAIGTLAGIAALIAGLWFWLRRRPDLRQRLTTKLFPARFNREQEPDMSEKPVLSNRFLRRITMRTNTTEDSSTLFGRSRGAPTVTNSMHLAYPGAIPPIADDDNQTERRYSRQNLVRASLLRRMPIAPSSDYSSTATPPPVYSSPPLATMPEKAAMAERYSGQTEVYVADGINYGERTPSPTSPQQRTNSSGPRTGPSYNSRFSATTTRTSITQTSEAPKFRGVNSWVSNQASRLVGGTVMPLPPTPVAVRHEGRESIASRATRESRGMRESIRGSVQRLNERRKFMRMSEATSVGMEHPGERMSIR
ncbi:hypothetical protein BJ508DRAFT_328934 [Ascobolus immersus RN42]|uniref:Uncharacterized protein n=1 Tax=Ascobolus immersus RN42 TaxID=1160509 RepID=A0A3N4I3V0_ASCIM|nr:hypothetical protein BJ508DRAFT_328934 [Ascobolus immersus RN42]